MEEIVPLIQRAQTGDAEAFGVIVSRFQDMAYGYAYAILSDFHLAQDAAQEAFVEAYQCLSDLREPLAFPAWLKRIVRKHCDRLTRGKRPTTAPMEAVADAPSRDPGPGELAERSDLARRVQSAIRALPDPQREVTTLFYINGYSHQEIADFLEVPAKTVKSRLHASRVRLRERMIDMVQDELKSNALPDGFTKETVEQAVAKANALNKESKYTEAEELLRQVLGQVPEHPGALKELNRAVMHGRVYGQSRWELLPELAEYGRTILKTVDDEYVHHELARTLLCIPAMPEAVEFIEAWIAKKGPDMERLGMLAWAKGCVADYDAAESLWADLLALSETAEPGDVLWRIPFVAYTLVDCFASAGELPRAQRVAREAWERSCNASGDNGMVWFNADADWMTIFRKAELGHEEIARYLLSHQPDSGPEAEAGSLSVRSWVDDPQIVVADWIGWMRGRIAAGEWDTLKRFRYAVTRGLEVRGEWRASTQLSQAVWELLGQSDSKEAQDQLLFWDWRRGRLWASVLAKDWEAADEIAERELREQGIQSCAWSLTYMVVIRGIPTPPELVQYIEEKGSLGHDLYEWYVVAREAAAAGDETKAFDTLRKALSFWTNPPYHSANIWENDPRWGELRNHPEFKAAFDERRRRIGPIHGLLHYFPGW